MEFRTRDVLLFALCFALGAGSAAYLYWPALTTYEVYHSDMRQSPHWVAYHTTSFRPDDMLVEYSQFNESPLQNTIYYVTTWFGDAISVSKVLSVVANGLATCLFFFVGRSMYGPRAGFLLAMFFTFVPTSFRYAEGFFSKFWAAPLLLLCLYVLHKERYRGLLLLLPFAALAYPMMAVLIGAACSVHLVLLWFSERSAARRLFGALAIGSTVAVSFLAVKYFFPPAFIGPMIQRAEILSHPIGGAAISVPIPSLLSDLGRRLGNPFVVVSAIVYLVILRRNVALTRSWASLFVASVVLYVIADLVFVRLYLPERYTDYSMAVLLASWHAANLDRIAARMRNPVLCHTALAVVLVVASLTYYGQGGRHMTRNGLDVADVASFIRTQPDGILLAGPPRYLDDISIQAGRSVLSSFKLNHGWYAGISTTLRQRSLACFRAIYAPDSQAINELHTRYGVTHLVLHQSYFGSKLEWGNFRSRYNEEIWREFTWRSDFLLREPPRGSVIYDDGDFTVLELPIGDP